MVQGKEKIKKMSLLKKASFNHSHVGVLVAR